MRSGREVRAPTSCRLLQYDRTHTRALGFMPDHFLAAKTANELLPGSAGNADRTHRKTEKSERQQLNAGSRTIQARGGCDLKKCRKISQRSECCEAEHSNPATDRRSEVEQDHGE